jgi:hypothetical protein
MGALRVNRLRFALPALLVTALLPVSSGAGAAAGARPAAVRIVGDVPLLVAHGAVMPVARHDASAVLSLNVGLDVRNSVELDSVIRAASTPGNPGFGHYLTPAQYRAGYAPTDAQVVAVRRWLTVAGLRVTGVSPDNLIVSAEATTATAEHAFGVVLNDYREGGRTFYSNDVAPAVPAGLGVQWVSGLSNNAVLRAFNQRPNGAATPIPAFRTFGYFPSDFQRGYGVTHVPLVPPSQANDETIGLTLWGAPLQQPDLTTFALNTLSQPITIGHAGPNGIDFIPCSTSTCTAVPPDIHHNEWDETAMDVESAHGIAPGTHLKYWLGSMSVQQGVLAPDLASVEHAVSAAANDGTVRIVSNSWGFNADVFDPNMDVSLQHAAAVGKTFFFSSGDTASISYPATSPYVVAVGGTRLNLDSGFNWVSETAWGLSGNGCSSVFTRPSWQIGVGSAPTCSGRAEPDVAADADPATGAYVFFDGNPAQIGGTSLAAPLWAGIAALWNEANLQASKPSLGFMAPLLYIFANNPSVYHSDFHDVVSGAAGGNPARPGWDQVTGWGSPNLAKLVTQYLSEATTTTTLSASPNPVGIGKTVLYTATVSPAPDGGTVAFRQNGVDIGGCGAAAVSGGHAHCSVSYGQSGTYRMQAGYSGDVAFEGSPSNTVFERVDPAPPPPVGYWMLGSTGDVYAFGADSWHGNAKTAGVTHFEPTPTRHGYWIVNSAGQVYAFGDAPALGNAALRPGETVSSLSATLTGHGYWLFTSAGRALTFGDAHFYGDLSGLRLNQPVIGSVATPSGRGYYMVASDGGIFAFGDAHFYGSTGAIHLNRPVNGLVVTPTNRGYWLVASDGGIFAFGDASFRGSMGGRPLNRPVIGMVRYGNGYLMVASDGGIFDFSDEPFLGSLAGAPLPAPIVSVAS